MTDPHSTPSDPDSDGALVARLYELACSDDNDDLARIDAMVYERLRRAYEDDSQASAV